ncbi:hypothetical protein DMJ13_12455 [halophilic archaeon]|nr:hypothetical protein DMJ13_12455 [halophilic archaeon]
MLARRTDSGRATTSLPGRDASGAVDESSVRREQRGDERPPVETHVEATGVGSQLPEYVAATSELFAANLYAGSSNHWPKAMLGSPLFQSSLDRWRRLDRGWKAVALGGLLTAAVQFGVALP